MPVVPCGGLFSSELHVVFEKELLALLLCGEFPGSPEGFVYHSIECVVGLHQRWVHRQRIVVVG